MIITLKQTNTKRFPEISAKEAPKTILRELVTASNKTGNNYWKSQYGHEMRSIVRFRRNGSDQREAYRQAARSCQQIN